MQKALIATMFLFAGVTQAWAGDPTGLWLMSNGKVTVKVAQCGGSLCGKIVALKKPLDKHGRPKIDKENPDQALRSRPVIGISLLDDMKPAGDGRWKGAIYNPDDGRTYDARMSVNGDVMKVKGCLAVFCKTREFIRVQ
jgi:uncharacterized protein (DUF2147 family)